MYLLIHALTSVLNLAHGWVITISMLYIKVIIYLSPYDDAGLANLIY